MIVFIRRVQTSENAFLALVATTPRPVASLPQASTKLTYMYGCTYMYIYIYVYTKNRCIRICRSGPKLPLVAGPPPPVTKLCRRPSVTNLCRGPLCGVLQSSLGSLRGVLVARRSGFVTSHVAQRLPGTCYRPDVLGLQPCVCIYKYTCIYIYIQHDTTCHVT